jgi:hypothetical protein
MLTIQFKNKVFEIPFRYEFIKEDPKQKLEISLGYLTMILNSLSYILSNHFFKKRPFLSLQNGVLRE